MNIIKKKQFVESYFLFLGQFSYNKAREVIDKEKDENTKSSLLWTSFLNLLGVLAAAEKNINSLNFIQSSNSRKLFWKKDTLTNTYETLLSDFSKMHVELSEEHVHNFNESLEKFILDLTGELQEICNARINIMIFYQHLFSPNNLKGINTLDNLNSIEQSLKKIDDSINHYCLLPFKSSLRIECQCMIDLLKTHISIQQCSYLNSVVNLLTATSKLTIFNSMKLCNENRKLALLSTKSISSELYDWMSKFKILLMAKFSLYFFNTLIIQSNANDVKSLLSSNPFDFYSRLTILQKKLDALIIVLIFNNTTIKSDLAYHLPNSDNYNLSQKNDIFFSYPQEKLEKYSKIILEQYNEKESEIQAVEKMHISVDEKLQLSMHFYSIDEHTTLGFIINRKIKIDSNNLSLLSNFCIDLKCIKLSVLLKIKL